MTENEVRSLLAEITADPDPEREYELRHPNCLIDIPQSGERFDREGMREMQRRRDLQRLSHPRVRGRHDRPRDPLLRRALRGAGWKSAVDAAG